MYSALKRILFLLDPEKAHYAALRSLNLAYLSGISRFFPSTPAAPVTIMGLSFPNPIGLAAGFDKNGDYVDALASLGFGFIEVGTVTPKPQDGNPKPRLFRLTEQEAIINRMGFNNKGLEHMARQLEKTKYRGILGINIGKNKDTPNERAVDDYLIGFRTLWRYASYVTINISSPNTAGLRDLQQSELLSNLLCVLKQEQRAVFLNEKKYVPLVVKISPDLNTEELHSMASVFLKEQVDGVIATNTTLQRNGVENSRYANEAGGLSGKPLLTRSSQITSQLHSLLKDRIPVIASGGVMDENAAQEKYTCGARLLQIYSGFIYSGPGLIQRLAKIQPPSR
jgi:dihydroorotate dehydrogenase